MNKFHQIPTDQFVPISHDYSYLFTHYDKVSNFLAFNLSRNYKNILAKPVQNGYVFDWFSVHEGLVNIKEYSRDETDAGLIKYWEFIDVVKAKIIELSNSSDEDRQNWASLLSKVFNHQDNFIFSNGKEISIVWGWKFDNNEIYKPSIANKPEASPFQDTVEVSPSTLQTEKNINAHKRNSLAEKTDEAKVEKLREKEEELEPILNFKEEKEENAEHLSKEDSVRKHGFSGFLKWFAGTYWWLLWLLTFLSAMVFFIKAYKLYY